MIKNYRSSSKRKWFATKLLFYHFKTHVCTCTHRYSRPFSDSRDVSNSLCTQEKSRLLRYDLTAMVVFIDSNWISSHFRLSNICSRCDNIVWLVFYQTLSAILFPTYFIFTLLSLRFTLFCWWNIYAMRLFAAKKRIIRICVCMCSIIAKTIILFPTNCVNWRTRRKCRA